MPVGVTLRIEFAPSNSPPDGLPRPARLCVPVAGPAAVPASVRLAGWLRSWRRLRAVVAPCRCGPGPWPRAARCPRSLARRGAVPPLSPHHRVGRTGLEPVTPCASCTPEASRAVRCRPGLVADLGGRGQCRSAPTREVHRRGYSRGYSDDPLRNAQNIIPRVRGRRMNNPWVAFELCRSSPEWVGRRSCGRWPRYLRPTASQSPRW